jgi:hypothetical protein
MTDADAKLGGEIAKSAAKEGKLDDEFPILVAIAHRLNRTIATANPERYKVIVRALPTIKILDIKTLRLP